MHAPSVSPAAGADRDRRPDGRSGLDPAHGGPLPQATLLELVGRLINDVSDLADRQIELAKQEIGEAKDEAIDAVKRLAIGAGIAVAAVLLLVIWAWTAFIWFFNWLFGFIQLPDADRNPEPGLVSAGCWACSCPRVAATFAYRRFIRRASIEAMAIWPPLPRTRETLKEDLEWVRPCGHRTRDNRLRGDMTAAVDELERRVRGGLRRWPRPKRASPARARGTRSIERARENPTLLGVGGVVAAGAVAYGAFALVNGLRQRNKPQNRLQAAASSSVGGELSEPVGPRASRARDASWNARCRAASVLKLEPEDGGYVRVSDARLDAAQQKKGPVDA